MDRPIPDGKVEILLFKDEHDLITYYFSEIETWKSPGHTFDKTLKIIFSDRVVNYLGENIKCYTMYPNSKQYQNQVSEWIRWQHDQGHPDENPYQCRHCIQSDEALAVLREKLTGDK